MKKLVLSVTAALCLSLMGPVVVFAKDTASTDTTSKAKVCKKGKPCGDTCIPMKATCSSDNAKAPAAAPAPADAAGKTKICKKGKPCGDTCIPQKAVCSMDKASTPGAEDAPAAAATKNTSETKAVHSKGEPKHCVKGKPCGNTCISMEDTCHM